MEKIFEQFETRKTSYISKMNKIFYEMMEGEEEKVEFLSEITANALRLAAMVYNFVGQLKPDMRSTAMMLQQLLFVKRTGEFQYLISWNKMLVDFYGGTNFCVRSSRKLEGGSGQ